MKDMDVNTFAYPKILHRLIRKFTESLQEYIEPTNIEKAKVFLEILKRRFSIAQGIRSIAINVLKYETTDTTEKDLDELVKVLLETYIQQDLIECALNSVNMPSRFLTDKDLQQSLYLCCINNENTLSISLIDDLPSFYMENIELFPSTNFQLPKTTEEIDCTSLSTQFERNKTQFKTDLFQLKKVLRKRDLSLPLENGSFSDNKSKENNFRLNREVDGCPRSAFSCEYNDSSYNISHLEDWLFCSSTNQSYDICKFSRNSWEGRMKHSVPCHLYTSEINEKEFSYNVTCEDPQIFRSLYSSTSSISENNLKHDILDLIVGIPSNTFIYDDIKKSFHINPHAHLNRLSHTSTLRLVQKFVDSGSMFRKLQSFSSELFLNENGLILKGLKTGIQQVLKLYTEYIMAVKVKKPSFYLMKTDVLEAAESLNILGSVCKIKVEENDFYSLPKGLGLLSYLKESLWPLRRKENSMVIGVILKYAYIPYFNYLEKWMDEGIRYDPHGEFQIMEDFNFMDRRDELYWKFAFTENVSDPMRVVPSEIQIYAPKILQCGKNMRLMKICCPELCSLEFMTHHPPPSLSLLFSYQAAKIKEEMCLAYINSKEKVEFENSKNISEEDILLNNQVSVSRADIVNKNKVRWTHLKSYITNSDCVKKAKNIQNCNPVKNLTTTCSLYNGIIYKDVGILFSSLDFDNIHENSPKHIKELQSLSVSNLNNVSHLDCKRNIPLSTSFQKSLSSCSIKVKETCTALYQSTDSNKVLGSKVDMKANKEMTIESYESPKVSSSILPRTFMNSLASLLTSECGGDTEQDIYSCLQLSSLQSLMFYSLRPVLDMRMHVVNKVIKDFVMNQLKFQDLLICLKNTYLLLDESFSQMLCEKLFQWVFKSETTHQFANFSVLNEIFCSSLSENSCNSFPLLSTGTVIVVDLPDNDILERNEFLHFFQFEFQISWPLNIIIHNTCIAQYMKIFSFLLELDFLCCLLGKMWKSMMSSAKSSEIQNSTQFRTIMLNRFDMHQFISVLRNCIRHDLQGPVWDSMMKSLNTEELSIDTLEEIHIHYLEIVLTRCFLTKETEILHELVKVMLCQVYKFCTWTLDSDWEYIESSKQYEVSVFKNLTSLIETYKKYQTAFYDRILRLTVTRSYGMLGHDGFKQYLNTLLESKRKFLS